MIDGMNSDEKLIEKVATYQPSETMLASVRQVPLLLAAGISGAGKDTVLQKLIAKYPNDYHFLVSHSTRPPRENNGVMEQDGVKYFFIDKPTAERMLDEGAYIEANYYAGNVYGASIGEIAQADQENKILVSDIDVNGIDNYVRRGMNAKPVFLLPPSYAVWQERLMKRYGEAVDAADLRERLGTALEELEFAMSHDYFYLVVNDDLDETVEFVHRIARGDNIAVHRDDATAISEEIASGIKTQLASL
jgi:guanylate kinase